MLKLLLLFIYIASIITVIFIERKRPTEAMLWVFVMVCLPYFGTILYLIFGNTTTIKLTAHIRNKRLNKVENKTTLTHVPLQDLSLSDEDKQVIHFNAVYNASPLTCYDDIAVYTNGKDHYEQLFQDLKQAKHTIFIEFYTIHHDIMGESLVRILTQKAKEGVCVYVMCDFIANLSTPKSMFKPLIDAGGKVIRLKPYLTHYRSHRKIVVIDNAISYIGGMNIGKQYANLAKKKNPWRDTQVRLTGASCEVLMHYFVSDWLCAIHKKQWDETIDTLNSMQLPTYQTTKQLAQFIIGGVDNDKEAVKMGYLSLIRSTKKRICIQSPYFIPDASILDALKTAAAAGVDIELMIPGIKASFFLDPVTTYYCGQLLEYGAHIYKYNGYIHAKTMIVDDEICAIGSVNMDMRSLMVDDEVCGIFYDNAFVQTYYEIFQEDCKQTKPYTKDMFDKRSRKERIAESFFLLFAPLM